MIYPIDLTGARFGKWTVLNREENKKFPGGQVHKQWRCLCDCGNEGKVLQGNLRKGGSLSCGCHQAEMMTNRVGAVNPLWRGGRSKTVKGYIRLFAGPIRGRLEHQVIMERHLGRPLAKGETVHHKNGVKDDNRIENLELWSGNHSSGQRVEDLTSWAVEVLRRYAPEKLR